MKVGKEIGCDCVLDTDHTLNMFKAKIITVASLVELNSPFSVELT